MLYKLELQVFPTSRSIREYVNSLKEKNILLPSIITIDEFFKKVLFFNDKKIIDEEERFLYLKEAVKSVDLISLGISSNFSEFLKQSDYIYRFFLELASEDVQIEDIKDYDTYDFYKEHLQILKQIKINYLTILEKNNAIDKINMKDFYKINENFLERYSSILINFEGYFTSFEFEIVKEISKKVNLEINFIYNNLNKKSIEKIISSGFDLELNNQYKINFSQKKILNKEKINSNNIYLDIKGFNSRINQIAYIKKSLVDLINKGVNPSKIALILPDESFAKYISLFDKEGYFNYAMGLNIYTTNLYKKVDSIYSYLDENEIKNKQSVLFNSLDIEYIDFLFKNNWNKNLSEEIYECIIEYFINDEKNKDLLEKFKELSYKFKRLIFSNDEKILLKDAYKIFLNKIKKITLDDVNSGKITVMGLLESRFTLFDAVIICDFNENLIPKRSLKDKFLSSSLKQKVNLPTPIDRENLQKYYYERLLSNTKYVNITYVKNDEEQLSRFATTLFDKKVNEKLYDNEYKHILYSNNQIKHYNSEISLDIDLSKRTWSASSLKEFLECKRRYYYNHIMKVKEHSISIRPKAYELGNIIHNTLEEYYKQDNLTYKKFIEIFNKNRSSNSFLNLDLEIWKKRLKDFIEIDNKRLDMGYKILELEKPFFCEYENIKIQGKIDRIEKIDDTYFVIDYKTSSNLKINTKRTYENATDFQLEFYYLALEDIYKTSNIKAFYYDLYEMQLKEEVVLDEKLEVLKNIFSSFKTNQISFEKCENRAFCQYCTYKIICNRE